VPTSSLLLLAVSALLLLVVAGLLLLAVTAKHRTTDLWLSF
jgi:hypothetical protein